MARIAVDIDSTLYDFETPAREAFTKLAQERGDRTLLRGAYHPWTEWRSPADACGLEPWLDAIAICHSAEIILAQEPFKGAVETCQALADEGHELLYISNRAVESADATHQWLQGWDFPLDENITEAEERHGGHAFKALVTDKKPFLKDCQYLIDDRPKTVVEFVYDADWELRVRRIANQIRQYGPDVDSPYWAKWKANMDLVLDARYRIDDYYYAGYPDEFVGYDDASVAEDEIIISDGLAESDRICNEAGDAYISAHRRRAFVLAYPYNQALTDIPHLYLAPTWSGLNEHLVDKGVLSQPAYLPLGVA